MSNGSESRFLWQVDEIVQKHIKKHNVVGGAIGIIENHQILCTRVFGYADKRQKKTVEQNTLFQAGSISKTITAWGIMKLVEDGKLELDQPVNTVLQSWKLPDSNFYSNEVTIKRLLSHTAGISIRGYYGYNNLDEANRKGELTDYLRIKYKPGTAFRYSGGGYTILQMVIESVTKLPFEVFMQNEVLVPLGMHNSTFDSNSIKDETMAKCYGLFTEQAKSKIFIEKAAAGLYTTITDLVGFVQKNTYHTLENQLDYQLLKSETIRAMHTKESRQMPYGLGCFSYNLPHNVKLIMHNGINPGWCSKFLLFPKSGDGIVILTNCDKSRNFISDIVNEFIEWKVPNLGEFYKGRIGMNKLGVMPTTKMYLGYVKSVVKGKHFY